MLHIILLIMKIIGIILLAVLILALTVLLCLLFVPLRYSFKASIYEEKHGYIKFSWLLHSVSFVMLYDNGQKKTGFRILGIPVRRRKRRRQEKIIRSRHRRQKDEEPEYDVDFEKNVVRDDENIHKISEQVVKEVANDTTKITVPKKKRRKIRLNPFKLIKKIRLKISSFFKKIKDINQKRKRLLDFLHNEDTKEAFKFCKTKFKKLIKHILPRKLKVNIRFGFSDPSITGRVLGLIYGFYGYVYKYKIYPDFENRVFEGEIQGKGQIKAVVLLVHGFGLWRNPHIKASMANFKEL